MGLHVTELPVSLNLGLTDYLEKVEVVQKIMKRVFNIKVYFVSHHGNTSFSMIKCQLLYCPTNHTVQLVVFSHFISRGSSLDFIL